MLQLPDAPDFRMSSAPLAQALAQIDFPIVPRLQTLEGVAPIQEALGGEFPYLEQNVVQQMSLMVGPAGPVAPQAAQHVVHELTNDAGWRLTITVSSVSLSIGEEYTGSGQFLQRLQKICDVLRSVSGIMRCNRIGVRYLDVVDISDSPSEWHTWFRPEIVGVAAPEVTGNTLLSSVTEARFRQEPDGSTENQLATEGILRYGVVPPGSLLSGVPPRPIESQSFILDMDTFVASPQPFDSDLLGAQFQHLHGEIERFFFWALTDEGKDRFGLEILGEEGQ